MVSQIPGSHPNRPKVAAVWIHRTKPPRAITSGALAIRRGGTRSMVLTKPNRLPRRGRHQFKTAKPPKTDAEVKPVAQDVQDKMDRPPT